jgi:hypothetical protein
VLSSCGHASRNSDLLQARSGSTSRVTCDVRFTHALMSMLWLPSASTSHRFFV